MAPDASVVVPAYEEADRLPDTLASLADQDAEVVVVAGGDDGTLDVASDHDAVDMAVADGLESGAGPARNQGARAANGEVLLFTDADTVVPERWVDRHVRHFDDPAVVGTGGPLRPRDGGRKHRLLFRLLSDWWYRLCWPIGFVQQSGNNAGFRRDEFLDTGGYDPEKAFIEDTELSLRMKRYGEVVYDPDCHVETSVRRHERQGYLGLFLTYVRGYIRHYLLGEELTAEYFREG